VLRSYHGDTEDTGATEFLMLLSKVFSVFPVLTVSRC
jgi:hypothetical protein